MNTIPEIEFYDKPSSRASSIDMESIEMEEVGEEFVYSSLRTVHVMLEANISKVLSASNQSQTRNILVRHHLLSEALL